MTDREKPDQPSAEDIAKVKKDKFIKSMFALTAILIVAYMIIGQYLTPSIDGWGNDLQKAIAQAKAENRQVVALMLDTPKNTDYQKLLGVIKKPDNVDAFNKGNFIGVQVRGGKKTEAAKKYKVTAFPTTILLDSEGEVICKWVGYIGEVDFRSDFLAGKKQ